MFALTTILACLTAIEFQCGSVRTAYKGTCSCSGNANTTVIVPAGKGIRNKSPARFSGEFFAVPGVFDETNTVSQAFLGYTQDNLAFGKSSDMVTSWMVSQPRYTLSEDHAIIEPVNSNTFVWEI